MFSMFIRDKLRIHCDSDPREELMEILDIPKGFHNFYLKLFYCTLNDVHVFSLFSCYLFHSAFSSLIALFFFTYTLITSQ